MANTKIVFKVEIETDTFLSAKTKFDNYLLCGEDLPTEVCKEIQELMQKASYIWHDALVKKFIDDKKCDV